MKFSKSRINRMIAEATICRDFAYAARSEHKIGASVITFDGRIFGGCNIESNVSGLGVCAERCAIQHAIVNGHYDIGGLLVVDKDFVIPCGACLQYLTEFYSIYMKEPEIISATLDGEIKRYKLLELIKYPFISKNRDKAKQYEKDYYKN